MVRPLCIDSALLGTQRHLVVCGDNDVAWSDVVPSNTWWLNGRCKDDSDWCADTVCKLAGVTLVNCRPHANALSTVLPRDFAGQIPWRWAIPRRIHEGWVKQLIDQVQVVLTSQFANYYETVWRSGNAVLQSLTRAHVDVSRWQQLLLARLGNVPAVQSFKPDGHGYAPAVVYDRFATLTGRLTVARGPQILTLKRGHRDLLTSRYGTGGTVCMFDFAALEARVLLYEAGGDCDHVDLYKSLADELNVSRQVVKSIVLGRLYGLGIKHITGVNGTGLRTILQYIDHNFGLPKLLKQIKAEFVDTGHITNKYGRQIVVDQPLDHVLINYWAQSTGVDVTMLGFHRIVEQLRQCAPRTVPLFVLHDAILLDVHNDDLPAVKQINSVQVPGFQPHFRVKLEKIG